MKVNTLFSSLLETLGRLSESSDQGSLITTFRQSPKSLQYHIKQLPDSRASKGQQRASGEAANSLSVSLQPASATGACEQGAIRGST